MNGSDWKRLSTSFLYTALKSVWLEEAALPRESYWGRVFAMSGDVEDRASRGLLLAYPEKIMNSNDSPKCGLEIYWACAFTPLSMYVTTSTIRILPAQMIYVERSWWCPASPLIQHLIIKQKMLFQFKPQTIWKGENSKTAKPRSRTNKLRKTDDEEKIHPLQNACLMCVKTLLVRSLSPSNLGTSWTSLLPKPM